ncbi:hypothetical protein D9M68_697940 [compost metagenome]
MAGVHGQRRQRIVGQRDDRHAALGCLARQLDGGGWIGGLRNHDQRIAGAQVVGLLGGRAAQAVDQYAVAAHQLVGVAHLEGNAERGAGSQETDLPGFQQGLYRRIEGRRRIQRAHGTHGLDLIFGQHVVSGRRGLARRGLQGGGTVAQPRLSFACQRLLEGKAEILVAGEPHGPRQPQHCGGRDAQRLGLAPHRPQPHFGRVRHHPPRRPLEFRGQVFQFFLEGEKQVRRQGHIRRYHGKNT